MEVEITRRRTNKPISLIRLLQTFFAEPCQGCPGGPCDDCIPHIVYDGSVLSDDIPEVNQLVVNGYPPGHKL